MYCSKTKWKLHVHMLAALASFNTLVVTGLMERARCLTEVFQGSVQNLSISIGF